MQKKAMRLKNNIGKRVLPEDVATAVNPFGYPQQILDNLKVTYTQNLARKEYQKWLTRQNFSAGEKAYRYIDDEGRIYRTASMAWPNNKKAPDAYFIPLNHPVTNLPCPVPSKGWRNPPETMRALMDKGLIIFGEDEKKQPERKYYLDENMNENTPSIISYGGSDDKLFRELGLKFDNPKPLYIAQYLIESIHKEGCTVLDFFAGSGTTGHAVLALNSTNKCQRKFILCTNNENSIAEDITYLRIKKIIEGYGSTQGIPANIRYFKTDFVDKQKSTDGTRAALVARCADMIRIRENCFDQIVDEKSHKFYANADKFVAVIFDPFSLGSVWKELEAANTSSLPVSLYVFSYSQYAYEDEIPETHLEYKSIPIPESILEVYQRIFRKQENGNV